MKALKLFFLAVIGSLSIGAAAQNYKVKGIVIDAYARPITGAKISTDKSKAVAYTDPSGVYTIEVMPRDKNLSLTIINDRVNMVKPISAEIAQNPVNFEVDDTRPLKGHLSKDGMTYFVGKEDENYEVCFDCDSGSVPDAVPGSSCFCNGSGGAPCCSDYY